MWAIFTVSVIVALGGIFVSPHAIRIVQQAQLRKRCGREHTLVLTYDDGPTNSATPRVLDLLLAHKAKATFFLVGRQAQAHRSLIQRMQNEGHELASHSQSHLNAWKAAPWRTFSDVRSGFKTLSDCGIQFQLFRPPYGKLNILTWMATFRRNIRLGWWTVVSGDTFSKRPDPNSIVQTVEQNGGAVVLLHDHDGSEERASYTLEVTRLLLETAKHRGWRVCTQSELLQLRKNPLTTP